MDRTPKDIRKRGSRISVPAPLEDDGRTEQAHKDSVDINAIVKRALRDGYLPRGSSEAVFLDVTGVSHKDYGELIDYIDGLQKELVEQQSELQQIEDAAKADARAQSVVDAAKQPEEAPAPPPPE